MARIRGTGLGAGMALGTAAVIREHNGIPIPPSVPERIALLAATHRLTETPEIVLVARDFMTALAISATITWAKVTAIAAETSPPEPPVPPFPAVVNLPGLLSKVQDDMLILVDAGNSFAVPDPDPMFLAQYTAEHDRIAPKRRIYLDEGHMPAQTIDGSEVQVFAIIDSASEVSTAISQGADGLFVRLGSELHRTAGAAQQKLLFAVIHEAAGKPIIIADNFSLPAMLLVEAAHEADITICVGTTSFMEGMGLSELNSALRRVENACFDDDIPASMPRIAALVPTVSQPMLSAEESQAWTDSAAACGATRIVFSLEEDGLSEGVLVELEQRLAAATRNLLPVYVAVGDLAFNTFGQNDLENSLETAVELLVGAGVSGILISPGQVHRAKTTITELNSQNSRERYHHVIGGVAAI